MAGLLRKTAQLFGGALNPANNLSVWGSLLAGSVEYSNDPDVIQSAAWLQGLAGALIGNKSPTEQDLNGLLYTITYQLQYLLSRGLAEYDPGTTYDLNDFCRVGKVIYISLVDNNTGNAPPSAQWSSFFDGVSGPNLAKAWVVINGMTNQVLSGFNVASVNFNGIGDYTVNFTTPLGANPSFSGTSDGLMYPLAPGSSSFRFQTRGLISGTFIPQNYAYVSALFFSN